jgi:biotin synthase
VGIRLAGGQTQDVSQYLADGDAFRTSGCPDCNRPFYNERPGGPMYNYARPLTLEEAFRAISEMAVPVDPQIGTD